MPNSLECAVGAQNRLVNEGDIFEKGNALSKSGKFDDDTGEVNL